MQSRPRLGHPPIDCQDFCQVRLWEEGDAEALQRHADDEQVSRYLHDRFPFPFTLADARAYVNASNADERDLHFAIAVQNEAVGGIGVYPGEDIYAFSAEIGYWLGRAWWNKGIITAVLKTMMPLLMRELRLYRVFAHCYANNPASGRVLEKAGFAREGVMRSAVVKKGRLMDAVLYAKTSGNLHETE